MFMLLKQVWALSPEFNTSQTQNIHMKENSHLHVCFVVSTDFLDPDVVLGIYKWLCSAVGLSDGHHTCNILEVTYVVHFDLQKNKNNYYPYFVY